MLKVTEGKTIHYVVDVGEQRGRHRGGVVVNVIDHEAMICDLRVWMDTRGDNTTDVLQVRAAQYENGVRPLGTWHYPDECGT
jgi:hypothetical protein